MSQLRIDPFVFTKKTVFMQRAADLVRSGHHHYLTGEAPLEKVAALAAKFDRIYATEMDRLTAHRARQKGMATARLLLLHQGESPMVRWLLLRTDGTVPAEADREKWLDPRETRIQLTGYELLRLTNEHNPKPVWTWRYTRTRYEELRVSLVQAIRHHRDQELQATIDLVWKSPGFSGIRQQVKKLKEIIQGEWKRVRAKRLQVVIPEHLGYVRRLADVGKKASVLQKAIAAKAAREAQQVMDLEES